MPRQTPPLDTGKVKIGLTYTQPMPTNDRHMDRVQSALLPPSKSVIRAYTDEWWQVMAESLLYTLALAMLAAIIFAPQLFRLFFGE